MKRKDNSRGLLFRPVALLLAFIFLFELASPTVALALTSMNTQPEVWGYQPVDATDNVSLTSGKFNYTVPITSIPEYPMAIGYSSGSGMEQEGGVFGFGFNGFSGAISRNVMGIPDDIRYGQKNYLYSNQKRWDVSVKGTFGVGSPPFAGISFGTSVSLQIGYNNYTGTYGALGIGLGLGSKVFKDALISPAGGIGMGFVSDSRTSGIQFGAGAAAGLSYNLYGADQAGGFENIASVGKNKILDDKSSQWQSSEFLAIGVGKSVFSGTTSTSAGSLAPICYVLPNTTGFGASLTVPLPMPPPMSLSLTGSYSQFKYGDDNITQAACGFMYLNDYDRSNRGMIADMTVEGEDSYNEAARNRPSYLQRDFFFANTMGLSGSMQLYQNEYGVVSRNYSRQQYRDFSLLGIKTDRKEVYPWTGVSQSTYNKGLDIIALLKKKSKPEDKDFDNLLFNEKELQSLNTAKHKFGGTELKMRGDMAGEFDLSSSTYTDHDVNKYDLIHIPGTGGTSLGLLKIEKDMPLLYPSPSSSDQASYDNPGPIERSTQITKRTIGSLLEVYNSVPFLQTNPAAGDDKAFNFNQSFYSHYKYNKTGSKQQMVVMNDNLSKINILSELKTLRNTASSITGNSYFDDLIGSIEMRSANGMRYFFNLPVFNKTTKTLQLAGGGDKNPEIEGGDYVSFFKNNGNAKDRNKSTVTDNYMYPYAWLLTAMVGDDYIDFDNIPGPSDGDIGYWVKFKYVKAAGDYFWRAPFTGLSHLPMALHDPSDDMYAMSCGVKEIYYLSEVESSNYLCSYTYKKRYDALDANQYTNGAAYNSLKQNESLVSSTDYTGDNFQFLVTKIDLYKKHTEGANSTLKSITGNNQFGLPVKSTEFQYDYSTCKGVPNNYSRKSGVNITQGSLGYHFDGQGYSPGSNIQTGKATLRRVKHIAYDAAGNAVALPSYEFNYWRGGADEYNPNYDKDQVDQWGNYSKGSKVMGVENPSVAYYHHYTESLQSQADENAKAFNLKEIILPSGGTMSVDYQAQSYGKVEDKTPYVMRRVDAISPSGADNTTVKIDITDLNGQSLQAAGLLKVEDNLYGEVAFYQEPKNADESRLFMSATDKISVTSFGSVVQENGKWYQYIDISNTDASAVTNYKNPFIGECKLYMYTESPQMRVLKEGGSLDKYLDMEKDSPLDAAKKIGKNIWNIFKNDPTFQDQFDDIYYGEPGTAFFKGLSFIRTPVYKAKYTGGVVSKIELRDKFNYATSSSGGTTQSDATDNIYGTKYYYDEKGDGTGLSAGVATIEPGGGKSCVVDVSKLTGAGFAPSPSVISSKTTLENLYRADNPNANNGDKVSRKKGKTTYEFYTSKDAGYKFGDNFKEGSVLSPDAKPHGSFFLFGVLLFLKVKIFKKWIKIPVPPFIIPLTIRWNRLDNYFVKGYSYTDNTDILGRPKNIIQSDASGVELGRQSFKYYGMDEAVNMYKNSFTPDAVKKKPGKMDQVWSEAYYSKESNIRLIWALLLNAETRKNYSYTNMKYSYIPPVLKEVSSTVDGLETVTTNKGFDYYTGTPLEVESNDSYKNKKISRTVPAYWQYSVMGPKPDENSSNLNNLTATTGTYMYLNDVDAAHLIGAGIVEWTDNSSTWGITNYIAPTRTYSTVASYNYKYEVLNGSTIKSAYNSAGASADKDAGKIQRNTSLYKTYRGYTYEVDLRQKGSVDGFGKPNDGTFASFTGFSYPNGAGNVANWKLLSTNELYSANGVLAQSKDVLNKYACQLLGFHFSNTIGAVSNGSYGASVYDGAENTYTNAAGVKMLEADRVKLEKATVIQTCQKTFTQKTLDLNTFPVNAGIKQGHILTITQPVSPVYNTVISKLDVTYTNGLKRVLHISVNDDGKYEVNSAEGESFDGFFEFRQSNTVTQLIFNPNDFSSFSLLSNILTQVGYSATLSTNSAVPACTVATKKYFIPDNDCTDEVHTGSYAFKLIGERTGVGTKYTLSPEVVNQQEFQRKYKALVWVHVSSADQTELVMQRKSAGGTILEEQSVSKATPYAKAGNWVLLRLDFDLTNAVYNTAPKFSEKAEVFVRNKLGGSISIYDDLRILPYHADMTNWVFEHKFNRVVSGLDNDHFASFSNYDARGRVVESAVELQDKGKNTVQKFLYNDQRKQ